MAYLKLFMSGYVEDLKKRLDKGDFNPYSLDKFLFDESAVRENRRFPIDGQLKLRLPEGSNHYDFENAKSLFEFYKNFSPVIATDARIWTYLAHTEYWQYMRRRWSLESPSEDYILEHWFLKSSNPSWLLRNGISRLWWGAFLTYDKDRSDPYELTKEAFSMLDYTRHLLPGTQGRSNNFRHALLEFVIKNDQLFSKYKEARVRYLMRKVNFLGGYKLFGSLTKEPLFEVFDKYKGELEDVTSPIKENEN